ncbi:acetyltransferase [Naegleria gruberi]|uniref:Acetyltransferase n=1 Tax=Naegleria gruberi TaxID=5762 RepID=D2VU92_NAEGR|nr:acetyltransferase [Naegleria gruberi]EFC39649.1 acetyltransferase [Naegleria gruberi]|eukprot:XP_002672393.1 acetyltransferase [Naegleria gruberi strain NEG-M]
MSSDKQQDEQQLIIKAIWDYNEIFKRRFGDSIVNHVYSGSETCAVPSTVDNPSAESTHHDIAQLFFYAYSTLPQFTVPHNDNTTSSPNNVDKEELNNHFIFEKESLIEKIAQHYIVCLFLPHQLNNSLVNRLKTKFPTTHQSKESGMIWKTSAPSTEFFNTQLNTMKTKHQWKLDTMRKFDTRVFCRLNCESLHNSSLTSEDQLKDKTIILKTATDNFEDFCKYFEITVEFASGNRMNPSLRKHLFNIYYRQVQLERAGGKPLSDYVIILENNEIASAGMILYGNELESKDYKENSNCAAIYSIATRDQFRGRGYATMIVVTLMELAKLRGYDHVILHASESGCNLYSKLGFEKKIDIDVCTIALFLDEEN